MKNLKLSLIIALLFTLVSQNSFAQKWWGNGVSGEGEKIRKTLDVDYFEGVSLHFSGNVTITHGDNIKVEAEGQENILDLIETDVSGKIWEIEFEKNVRSHKGINIYITMPKLVKAYISGSGDIETTNHFPRVSEFYSGISGSGDLMVDIDADEVTTKISGSGNIELHGKAEQLTVKISGSGDVNTYNLDAHDVEVAIAGSGDCKVSAQKSLNVRVSGSGDVYYKGNPEKLRSSVSGSGDVVSRN